jgi:hypothetical protein
MPLRRARMTHIGRRVYQFHTTASALAIPSAKIWEDLRYLPLDSGDDRALVDKQCMLLGDRPSSINNVLSSVSSTYRVNKSAHPSIPRPLRYPA